MRHCMIGTGCNALIFMTHAISAVPEPRSIVDPRIIENNVEIIRRLAEKYSYFIVVRYDLQMSLLVLSPCKPET